MDVWAAMQNENDDALIIWIELWDTIKSKCRTSANNQIHVERTVSSRSNYLMY